MAKPRHAAQERLQAVELLLWWRGHLNRSDLVRRFGISLQQASTDIQDYWRMNRRGVRYDPSRKRYFARPGMRRLWGAGRTLEEGLVDLGRSSPQEPIPVTKAVVLSREPRPEISQAIVRAISSHAALRVRYASLNSRSYRWRWIAPHALVHDGRRWHARAWCCEDQEYKDFVLTRMTATGATAPWPDSAGTDRDWYEYETIEAVPGSGMNAAQRRALAEQYAFRNGRLTVRVRRALRVYVLAQLGIVEAELPMRFELVGDRK